MVMIGEKMFPRPFVISIEYVALANALAHASCSLSKRRIMSDSIDIDLIVWML